MITVDDLKEPEGELDLALLFPDLTATQAEDNLQVWLDLAMDKLEAVGIVDEEVLDRGQKAYAYFRAYKSIHQRLTSRPASKNIQDAGISVTMNQAQIDEFKEKYLEWELAWTATLVVITTASPNLPTTQAIPTEFGF